MRPAQSPRGGGHHFQQQSVEATNLKHLPGYKGHEQAQPTKDSSGGGGDGISKDLLESVAGLSKLPVWKPNEKPGSTPTGHGVTTTPTYRGGGSSSHRQSSPSKTPVNVTDVTPEHHTASIRRTSSVASDKDKSFEELVKKVESSPQKANNKIEAAESLKAAESMSDPDKSDYDDTKGGVDYDDYNDFEEEEYVPAKGSRGRGRSTRSTGSRGRPPGPAVAAKGALAKARPFKASRGHRKARVIDTKGLEKVHRTVAGTDYDFEDEFGDEFGESKTKEPEVSLKELREQSKKQNLPVYMQKKEEPIDEFGFDDIIPLASKKKQQSDLASLKQVRGRAGRGGARGRGRPPKKEQQTRMSSFDFDDDLNDGDDDDDDSQDVVHKNLKKQTVPPPKVPKLRLGAMLASSRKEKHRRESSELLESSAAVVKVPKLKIKLGPKPEATKAEAVDEIVMAKIENPEVPAVKDVAAKEVIFKESPFEAADKTKPSPASSPTKKGSRIDSLAERLLKQTSTSGGPSNDLESIFGPMGVTLDMSNAEAGRHHAPDEATAGKKDLLVEAGGKSELDLLREEIERAPVIQSSPAGASPHADTVYGPLRKAINASRSAAEKEKAADVASEISDSISRKHLKFKFKGVDERHSSSTTPPPTATSSHPTPVPVASTASMPSSNHHRRMRKKELLNQYYGQDIYPAPTNGPTASTLPSNSYDPGPSVVAHHHPVEQPPTPRPIIKMPKAVASVTSVPTRADYQQQLEANLERKRKREKGDMGLNNDFAMSNLGRSGDKGKKKRGRGGRTADDDIEYRPKMTSISALSMGSGHHGPSLSATTMMNHTKKAADDAEKTRKTRGKPPKKCLADSPTHEPGDLKAESMKFAEEIRAQFDEPKAAGGPKGSKKKKRKAPTISEEVAAVAAATGSTAAKTPRLVIKFSKDSEAVAKAAKENGGRDEYDFDANKTAVPIVDGTVDSAFSSVNNSPVEAKVTKIKIKI
jgi:hypothetical protein